MSECPGYVLIAKWSATYSDGRSYPVHQRGLPREDNLGCVGVQCQCEKNLSHEVAFHFGIKQFLAVMLCREPSFITSTEWRGEFWRFYLYT
jgi:hypothetical protein